MSAVLTGLEAAIWTSIVLPVVAMMIEDLQTGRTNQKFLKVN